VPALDLRLHSVFFRTLSEIFQSGAPLIITAVGEEVGRDVVRVMVEKGYAPKVLIENPGALREIIRIGELDTSRVDLASGSGTISVAVPPQLEAAVYSLRCYLTGLFRGLLSEMLGENIFVNPLPSGARGRLLFEVCVRDAWLQQ